MYFKVRRTTETFYVSCILIGGGANRNVPVSNFVTRSQRGMNETVVGYFAFTSDGGDGIARMQSGPSRFSSYLRD